MKTKLTKKTLALILGVNAVKWITYTKPPLQLEKEISQSPKVAQRNRNEETRAF